MHRDSHGFLDQPEEVPPWRAWLAECRRTFGEAPRHFDRATENRLLVNPPWITRLRFGNPLARLVQNSTLRDLFRDGSVVWGYVIQANEELLEPSPRDESYTYDRPGEIVFSPTDNAKITPEHLEQVAKFLSALRRTGKLDPELQSWADYLNAETTRVVGKPVPDRLNLGPPCYASTTLFRRSHLPDGMLQKPLLPIVVAPQQPFYAMALPREFWPESMLEWWSGA